MDAQSSVSSSHSASLRRVKILLRSIRRQNQMPPRAGNDVARYSLRCNFGVVQGLIDGGKVALGKYEVFLIHGTYIDIIMLRMA